LDRQGGHGRAGPAVGDRHVQGVQDELRGQVIAHAPADHAAAEAVQHHREVEEARPGRDVGSLQQELWSERRRTLTSFQAAIADLLV
jgi:hypothetical protein